jgi:hypothetical protein
MTASVATKIANHCTASSASGAEPFAELEASITRLAASTPMSSAATVHLVRELARYSRGVRSRTVMSSSGGGTTQLSRAT